MDEEKAQGKKPFRGRYKAIKEKVKREYLLGQWGTIKELSRKYNIRYLTLWNWIRKEGWEEERLELERRAKEKEKPLEEQIREHNNRYMTLWNHLLAAALEYLREARAAGTLKLADIERISRIMTRSQYWQNVSLNIDPRSLQRKDKAGIAPKRPDEMTDAELKAEFERTLHELQDTIRDLELPPPETGNPSAAGQG